MSSGPLRGTRLAAVLGLGLAFAAPIAPAQADSALEDPGGKLIPSFEGLVERGTTGAGLAYEAAGAGRPVVLLHGFSLDRRMWDREAAVLAADHRVIRYDLRGHGESAVWSEPFSAHDDLLSVLEELGLERAVLVGLSAGAEVALDFALAHPDRVEALFLASPGLGGYRPQGPFDWMTPTLEALRAGDPREATRRWAATPLMQVEDPDRAAAVRRMTEENWRVWTYARELQRRLDPPAIERLEQITVPTTVLVGALDLPDTQAVADILAERIPGARKLTLPGAGHLANLATPGPFETALREFLAGLPEGPQPSKDAG